MKTSKKRKGTGTVDTFGNCGEAFLPRVKSAHYFESRAATKPRKVTCFETSLYTSGGGVLWVNGARYDIKENGVRFVRPGDTVSSEPPFRCMTAVFTVNDIDTSRHEVLSGIPGYIEANGDIARLFERCVRQNGDDSVCGKILLGAYVTQLICALYTLSNKASGTYPEAVERCISLMKQSYREKITLDSLGRISGYAPLYLLRLFKRTVGMTPHAYLTGVRISKAKELLKTTRLPLPDICESCGFESLSHFQTLFKSSVGITPAKYRKSFDFDM